MSKRKQKQQQQHEHEEERETDESEEGKCLTAASDLCHQLMERYSKSSAPQHRHLLATAIAMRSILQAESLPLTPSAYFAAAISAIDNASASQSLDSIALSALSSFLSITLPLVHPGGIAASNASEAVSVVVGLLGRECLTVSSVRAVVKSLGILLGFCDLEDWGSIQLGFEILLKFSVDRRPKVRRCAQDCLNMILNSLKHSAVIKEASKLVFSLLESCMPLAIKLSTLASPDKPEEDNESKSQHLDVLHMLNVIILAIPFLSKKVRLKMLKEISKLVRPQFTAITMHAFKSIEAILKSSKAGAIALEVENIIVLVGSYISLGDKNPSDTVVSATTLLKCAMDVGDSSIRIRNLPVMCDYMADLLTSDVSKALHASRAVKELIQDICLIGEDQKLEEYPLEGIEVNSIKSTCVIFENILNRSDGDPGEHVLAVISALYLKLGATSFIFMKNILLKLADLMNFPGNISNIDHIQNCIGSAVIAMGPEKILSLIPVSINSGDLTVQNMWLVPILQNHIVGASLGYYLEHIVPLAKSFHQERQRVKKNAVGKNLETCACNLWRLLPAFCRHPTDMHRSIGMLADVLITLLKEDSFMHEDIAVALEVLVNQNKVVLNPKKDGGQSNSYVPEDSVLEFGNVPAYSKKTATKNLKALASSSARLLEALTDLFVDSAPTKRSRLKVAIGCLASITVSGITKNIFTSLLEKFQFLNAKGEFEELRGKADELAQNAEENLRTRENDLQRCVMLELASGIIQGAEEDLIDLIYNFTKLSFQASSELDQHEAYQSLSSILEELTRFASSRFSELVDMLLDLQPPIDTASQQSRFACLHILMVHSLKVTSDEDNKKAFLILNEIILALKSAEEGSRKVAYDALRRLCCSLRDSSYTNSDAHHKFMSMILGYLSGASPHIKSGAISALSVMVYEDADVCLSMPDLVPSLLSLLQGKDVEVIKAVLGFVKVLVSSLQVKKLHSIIFDVLVAALPWSNVSRNHFRSKVTVILEILMRKCGYAAIESFTPERYKGFIRTLWESRHNKASSKDAGGAVTDIAVADSPANNGARDQAHAELHPQPKKNGSGHPRKRKREQNYDSITYKTDDMVTGDGDRFKMKKRAITSSKERISMKNGPRRGHEEKFMRYNGPRTGGNRKIEHKNSSKKEISGFHRPAKASKSKHEKYSK